MCVADCRKNLYDGVEEYYVVTAEKGQRAQEESQEETRRSTQKLEASSCFQLQQLNARSDEGNTIARISCCKQMGFGIQSYVYKPLSMFTFFTCIYIYICDYMCACAYIEHR